MHSDTWTRATRKARQAPAVTRDPRVAYFLRFLVAVFFLVALFFFLAIASPPFYSLSVDFIDRLSTRF